MYTTDANKSQVRMYFRLSGCPLAASFDSALSKEAVAILLRLMTLIEDYTLKKEPPKNKQKIQVLSFLQI